MLLGHWFLVSPRMPRWPLRALAVVGGAAILLDWLVHLVPGVPPAASTGPLIASVALAAASVLLMAAVWFALGYPSYPGVMAATGLSYLAVLTSLGSVILVRALAAGVLSHLSGRFPLFSDHRHRASIRVRKTGVVG